MLVNLFWKHIFKHKKRGKLEVAWPFLLGSVHGYWFKSGHSLADAFPGYLFSVLECTNFFCKICVSENWNQELCKSKISLKHISITVQKMWSIVLINSGPEPMLFKFFPIFITTQEKGYPPILGLICSISSQFIPLLFYAVYEKSVARY